MDINWWQFFTVSGRTSVRTRSHASQRRTTSPCAAVAVPSAISRRRWTGGSCTLASVPCRRCVRRTTRGSSRAPASCPVTVRWWSEATTGIFTFITYTAAPRSPPSRHTTITWCIWSPTELGSCSSPAPRGAGRFQFCGEWRLMTWSKLLIIYYFIT